MRHDSGHHEFALYYSDLWRVVSSGKPGTVQEIDLARKDPLVHRLINVLRMNVGDTFIIFDNDCRAVAQIVNINTLGAVALKLQEVARVSRSKPNVTLVLPLLKGEALEEAVYGAVEAGVSAIAFLITAKTQRAWRFSDKDRIHKTIIAACEQAKNYEVPEIYEPQKLSEFLRKGCLLNNADDGGALRLVFDSEGECILSYCERLSKAHSITLLIGPEGGLTQEEKRMLYEYNFISSHLTSTILRARSAAQIGVALVRSLVPPT